jgi:hypothetical protein
VDDASVSSHPIITRRSAGEQQQAPGGRESRGLRASPSFGGPALNPRSQSPLFVRKEATGFLPISHEHQEVPGVLAFNFGEMPSASHSQTSMSRPVTDQVMSPQSYALGEGLVERLV